MRNFFRSLEKNKVRWLLISGQATVLYGAATFSEDVDLWISPTVPNLHSFIRSLREVRATIHKLTPPLTLRNFRRGHGFHFLLPQRNSESVYLDVMGRPPRVGSFAKAFHGASKLRTDWGNIPVVGIPELVELKKTRRFADYDIISNLVRIRLGKHSVDRRLLRWGLQNCFRVEDAQWILETWPQAELVMRKVKRPWLLKLGKTSGTLSSAQLDRVQTLLAKEIVYLQQKDIAYWSEIIQELRQMRSDGVLLPEGSSFRSKYYGSYSGS